MNAYNLEQIVGFCARISKNRGKKIDNTFFNKAKLNCSLGYLTINGMSVYDEQVLMLDRTQSQFQNITLRASTRLINNTELMNHCQFSVSFKERIMEVLMMSAVCLIMSIVCLR
jgi:hypothetical protein